MKAASLSFLNDEVWTASCVKQGRYLRIFYFQRGIHNVQRILLCIPVLKCCSLNSIFFLVWIIFTFTQINFSLTFVSACIHKTRLLIFQWGQWVSQWLCIWLLYEISLCDLRDISQCLLAIGRTLLTSYKMRSFLSITGLSAFSLLALRYLERCGGEALHGDL